jgi:hypothetical protein
MLIFRPLIKMRALNSKSIKQPKKKKNQGPRLTLTPSHSFRAHEVESSSPPTSLNQHHQPR